MTAYIGGESAGGKKLKATSLGGTDEYGFSALLGGSGDSYGNFYNGGDYGYWWTASEHNNIHAYFLGIYFHSDGANWSNYDKSYLLSVRCLQGSGSDVSSSSSLVQSSSSSVSSSSSLVQSSSSVVSSSSSIVPSSSSAVSSSSSVVLCTANNNTSTQYCSNGTLKDYGFVTYGNQTYKTVVIGEQTWFAENLNYNVEDSYCSEDDSANCTKYGRLYPWVRAMNLPLSCSSDYCSSQINSPHRGICPEGWHIPSKADWEVMMAYIGSNGGRKLKAISGWNSKGNGSDDFGFSALPGGYSGYYTGERGDWCSASEEAHIGMSGFSMSYDYSFADMHSFGKYNGLSVRCLQD